jgi:hypothetical protein
MRGRTQDESRMKNAPLGKKLHCCIIDFSLIGFDIYCRTDVIIMIKLFAFFSKVFSVSRNSGTRIGKMII